MKHVTTAKEAIDAADSAVQGLSRSHLLEDEQIALMAAVEAIRQIPVADDPRVSALVEALLEARAYVPEHHGPVIYKIDTALAAFAPTKKETTE